MRIEAKVVKTGQFIAVIQVDMFNNNNNNNNNNSNDNNDIHYKKKSKNSKLVATGRHTKFLKIQSKL